MNRSDQFEEIRLIADDVCANTVTHEQLAHLQQLLRGNFNAQKFYYDYLSMHVHLIPSLDREMEFVYRRMTMAEEFVMRPKGSGDKSSPKLIDGKTIENSQASHPKIYIKVLILSFVILLLFVWFFSHRDSTPVVAEITQGKLSIVGEQGDISGEGLIAGLYQTERGASLQLVDGAKLHLEKNSLFKIFNNKEIRVRRGKITLEPTPGNNTIIHHPAFLVVSNGSAVTLDLTHNAPRLTTGENARLLPTRWRPVHYWNFNGNSDRVIDSAGNAYGISASGATRVRGIVGDAFHFDNSGNARIEVGSGGGTVPGTGSFAVSDGVTIEALIRPEFTGEFGEIDEIFRKDHGDNGLRMLLSFQNDAGKQNLMPPGDVKESLSFGLYILGQGYHELKLPLDGKEGRPTLAEMKDGKFHHVAATYNVRTGLKAIYINGKRLASYKYPRGSKMLSGGPGNAAIGNIPTPNRWAVEAFSGVIDEVAFYDFAIPDYTLGMHLKNVKSGHDYFGFPVSEKSLPNKVRLELPANTTVELDKKTGLPIRLVD